MESKAKAVQLFLLAYGTSHGGMTFSAIGPSLPDLQCLFNVELGDIGSLFLVLGLAVAGSSLISTYLIRMINMYMLMASLTLLYSVGIGVLALTPYIYVAWFSLFVSGFASGVYFVCSMVLCNTFHKGDAYALHILATALSFGDCLGPLLAKPFLGTTASNIAIDNASFLNNSSPTNVSNNMSCALTTSHVPVLFIIIGVLALPTSFGLCFFYLLVKPQVEYGNVPIKMSCQIDTNGVSVTRIAYTMVVFLTFPMTYGVVFGYGSFLTTIGVNGTLRLGIQKGALMTSLFWLMFLFGRLASTVLTNYIEQQTLMYLCLTGQIISSGALCLCETWGELALWIGSLSFAFISSPNFACLVAWSRDYITLSPSILSIYGLMDFAGTSVLPYISGVLINMYGNNAHLYFTFSLCVLELVLFVAAHGLGLKLSTDTKDVDSGIEHFINNSGKIYGSFDDDTQHEP